ncbi:MAG: DUF559 domain-containing protein [Hyphomicrobiales bacterium]
MSRKRLVPVARRLRRDMTGPERALWQRLRELKAQGFHFRKQAPIGPYVVDFAWLAGRLVIEIDGDTHANPAAAEKDEDRDAFLRHRGFEVLRFSNGDVARNIEGVLHTIVNSKWKLACGMAEHPQTTD